MFITNHKNRYTLVELLVTLAVIGIMATLLVQVMSVAFNKAENQQCMQNLKQIGILDHDFTNNNNSTIFKGYDFYKDDPADSKFQKKLWCELDEYRGTWNPEILVCPADRYAVEGLEDSPNFTKGLNEPSYGRNADLQRDKEDRKGNIETPPIRLSRVIRPSDKINYADSGHNERDGAPDERPKKVGNMGQSYNIKREKEWDEYGVYARHGNASTANSLFFDLHVGRFDSVIASDDPACINYTGGHEMSIKHWFIEKDRED